jgi:hypothetical protein
MTGKRAALGLAGCLVLGAASAANGAAVVGAVANWGRLAQRVETTPLMQQVHQLRQHIMALQQSADAAPQPDSNLSKDDVRKLVADYLREKEGRNAEGGTDLKINASWKDGFTFTTASPDFASHFSGWPTRDNIFSWNLHAWVQLDGVMGLNPSRR